MKQREVVYTTTYRWWNIDGESGIHHEDIKELDEHAKNITLELIKDGYTSGQLCACVNDREYSGWWEYSDLINPETSLSSLIQSDTDKLYNITYKKILDSLLQK